MSTSSLQKNKTFAICIGFSFFLLVTCLTIFFSIKTMTDSFVRGVSMNNNISFGAEKVSVSWNGPFPVISLKNVHIEPSGKIKSIAIKNISATVSPSISLGDINISNIKLSRVSTYWKQNGKYKHINLRKISGSVKIRKNGDMLIQKAVIEIGKGNKEGNVTVSNAVIGSDNYQGNFRVKNVDVLPFYKSFGYGGAVSSLLIDDVNVYIESSLKGNPKIYGDVKLSDITLSDSSLSNTLASLAHGKISSGEMRFKSIQFKIQNTKKGSLIKGIKANAKSFNVESGEVSIDNNKKIKGMISTSSFAGLAGFDLDVSGEMDNINLSIDKKFAVKKIAGGSAGAVIGAVVGSAIGPAGTIIGIGLGSKIDKLIDIVLP